MKKTVICLGTLLFCLAVFCPAPGAAGAPAGTKNLMEWQLAAISANDQQQFIAKGNRAFKDMMDGFLFAGLVMQYGAKLEKGYALQYLGAIQRLGMTEHLWRISINDYKYELFGGISLSHVAVVGFKLE